MLLFFLSFSCLFLFRMNTKQGETKRRRERKRKGLELKHFRLKHFTLVLEVRSKDTIHFGKGVSDRFHPRGMESREDAWGPGKERTNPTGSSPLGSPWKAGPDRTGSGRLTQVHFLNSRKTDPKGIDIFSS